MENKNMFYNRNKKFFDFVEKILFYENMDVIAIVCIFISLIFWLGYWTGKGQ